jgi:hypothetical protein
VPHVESLQAATALWTSSPSSQPSETSHIIWAQAVGRNHPGGGCHARLRARTWTGCDESAQCGIERDANTERRRATGACPRPDLHRRDVGTRAERHANQRPRTEDRLEAASAPAQQGKLGAWSGRFGSHIVWRVGYPGQVPPMDRGPAARSIVPRRTCVPQTGRDRPGPGSAGLAAALGILRRRHRSS